jgi:hypothetical protein
VAEQPPTAPTVDFAHQVAPILQGHCVECHGGREAKGGFSINTRELLENSGYIDIGSPDDSQLIALIESGDPDIQMPPPEKSRVAAPDIQTLRQWISAGLPWDDGFSFTASSYEPPLKPRRPELPPSVDGREHPIDRIIDAYLQQHQFDQPAEIDDGEFLRRASLDLVGLLPEPEVLTEFLADHSLNKRERMIDQLLQSEIAYADHWMTFFNDLLRNDYSGTGFITGGRKQISTWLHDALVANKPFDVMARELIAPPTSDSSGYIDGIRWRGEVSAGQSVEIQFAQSVSQSFLGINMKCASCHDSFIDRWTLDEAYGLAAIYATTPLVIHRCDKPLERQATAHWLFPELGQVDAEAPRDQRLKQLAELMTHQDNGRFARTIVNRLWYRLMGRGIVHPLDAMQTEPWNADLLDYLAISLRDDRYDLKALLRLIATSQAYQSRSVVQVAESTSDYVYHGPLARRMTAEQFVDSVWQVTESAPNMIDAPVFRVPADEAQSAKVQLQAKWIWGGSAADGKLPAGGESLSLRKSFTLGGPVQRGGAVITCDNSYTLYVNGREVSRGDDWTQPQAVVLHSLLKKGDNQFVVVATNAGNTPNPAGLFFEARLVADDGKEMVISSDESWEFNPKTPVGHEGRLGGIAGKWKPVVVVSPVAAWAKAVDAAAPRRLAQAISGDSSMVRASLMKNDYLMKSLGRPMRDQIVSMRPSELTTLEAIDLSNGPTLAQSLSRGAAQLAERQWTSREQLVQYVFQFALSRDPRDDERKAIAEFLSEHPSDEEVEDLLWSVFMMPEFLLVR